MRKKKIEERRQKKIEQGIPLDPSDEYQYQDYDDFWNDSLKVKLLLLQNRFIYLMKLYK